MGRCLGFTVRGLDYCGLGPWGTVTGVESFWQGSWVYSKRIGLLWVRALGTITGVESFGQVSWVYSKRIGLLWARALGHSNRGGVSWAGVLVNSFIFSIGKP